MRVQHNIAAMNAYRNFSTNNSKLNKNLEKLSTGYKINRAGDDAAGLAISEKMRAQISGIEGATKNSKDGISLIQTAEGALTEVHDMLNRMTTLAEQSANGTYDDEVDRNQLQKEVEALKSEINRIADSTNYNGMKLLNGELDSSVDTKTVDSTEWSPIKDSFLAANAASGGVVGSGTILHNGNTITAQSAEFSVNLNNLTPAFDMNTAVGNTLDKVTVRIGKNANTNGNVDTTPTGDAGLVDQNLTVTADEISRVSGNSTTERIAKALFYKYGGAEGAKAQVADGIASSYDEATGTLSNDGITQGTAGITINGIDTHDNAIAEHFDVSLGDDGVSLKFTQTTPPRDPDHVVDTRLEVSIETTNYSVNSTPAVTGTNGLKIEDFAINPEAGADAAAVNAFKEALIDGLDFTLATGANGSFAAETTLTMGATAITSVGGGGVLKVTWTNAQGIESEDATIKAKATGDLDVDNTDEIDSSAASISFTVRDASDKAIATFSVKTADWAQGSQTNTFHLQLDNDTGAASTDYNAATTVISNAVPSDAARLASTYVKTEDLWTKIKDGSQMKIGDEVYTFAVGSESTVDTSGKNVVDLTDLQADANNQVDKTGNNYGQMKTALQRLTEVAAGNEMYSVGFDENGGVNGETNGILTLTENVTYSGGADLSTRAGIASTIQFAEAAKTTINEDGIKGKALTLQIGDTSDSFNKMSVDIKDMHADSIGIGDVDISTQEGASKALDSIKNAVNVVSDVRGSLGALQNRLDHTINNLGVMRENIQNAESLIRDTDVAEEMMTYTKNNILNQSAQAMLAQANQLPQGVLQLLG